MGYQEAFRPIKHLAESAGIKKAIEDYEGNPHVPEYCCYACTARERATGNLYACIIGQRCRVTIVAGIFLDYRVPVDGKYDDYYEDLDEALVEEAARERPDLVKKAYREVAMSFEREVKRGLERERALREEATELWPRVARLLLACGPLSERAISSHPMFEGHFMWNVLVDLERQGLVTCEGQFAWDALHLTDKALHEFGYEEMPAPMGDYDLLVFFLDECGPLGTATLSDLLDRNSSKVLAMLHHLMDKGRVVPTGRGRSRKYRLIEAVEQGDEVAKQADDSTMQRAS